VAEAHFVIKPALRVHVCSKCASRMLPRVNGYLLQTTAVFGLWCFFALGLG